jgi:uncharacterized coiled-coil DUF342 family protein
MSLSSESEHRKKLNKIRENTTKRVNDIRDHFAKIEKVKVDALKKTEEMRKSAAKDIAKLETDIAMSDLGSEIKTKLTADITVLKKEIEDRAAELRNRISGTVVPS